MSRRKFGKQNPSNSSRMQQSAAPDGAPVELENQFILRIPQEPASALREAIRSGASNLKERLFIQLEPDKTSNPQHLRRGHVQFDGWNFTCRLMDLPTIIESHKTIDNKTFYKTADICQLVICKEEEDFDDEESPLKKKKDPHKVDKKYLYPHGICPPLKNCRKRRFRKTLKKKYVEAPEIEKEVKRLLRHDNEAHKVKWEVITEEELNANKEGEAGTENPDVKPSESGGFTNDPKDLGLDLSDSDNDEERKDIDIDSEEGSRLSGGEDSRMSDSMSTTLDRTMERKSSPAEVGPTQFSRDMFNSPHTPITPGTSSTPRRPKVGDGAGPSNSPRDFEKRRQEIGVLLSRRRELEHNIASCPNEMLKLTFQQQLEQVCSEIEAKQEGGSPFQHLSY